MLTVTLIASGAHEVSNDALDRRGSSRIASAMAAVRGTGVWSVGGGASGSSGMATRRRFDLSMQNGVVHRFAVGRANSFGFGDSDDADQWVLRLRWCLDHRSSQPAEQNENERGVGLTTEPIIPATASRSSQFRSRKMSDLVRRLRPSKSDTRGLAPPAVPASVKRRHRAAEKGGVRSAPSAGRPSGSDGKMASAADATAPLVRLELGDGSASLSALKVVNPSQLGASLVLFAAMPPRPATAPFADGSASSGTLCASDGDAAAVERPVPLGVICEVKKHRGVLTLTARSTIRVYNHTAYSLLVTRGTSHSVATAPTAQHGYVLHGDIADVSLGGAVAVEAGQHMALPVGFTADGSQTSAWALCMQPNVDEEMPWDAGEMVQWTPEAAWLVCKPRRGSHAQPWMALVHIQEVALPLLGAGPIRDRETAGAAGAGPIDAVLARKGRVVVQRFGLPATERLIETLPCARVHNGSKLTGKIHLTSGYLCTEHGEHRLTLMWADLTNPVFADEFGEGHEVHIEVCREPSNDTAALAAGAHGEPQSLRLIFSKEGVPREQALRRMQDARRHALKGAIPRPATSHAHDELWWPREITVCAPLTITSHLPCPVQLSLRQVAPFDAAATSAGSAPLGGDEPPLPPLVPSNNHVDVTLPPKASHRTHSVHAVTPLEMRVWVGGSDDERASLHGMAIVRRPATHDAERAIILRLHPPGKPHSSHAVTLHIDMIPRETGTLEVALSVPHCVRNLSSVTVALHHSSGVGGSAAIMRRSEGGSRPFSLGHGEDGRLEERARLSVPFQPKASRVSWRRAGAPSAAPDGTMTPGAGSKRRAHPRNLARGVADRGGSQPREVVATPRRRPSTNLPDAADDVRSSHPSTHPRAGPGEFEMPRSQGRSAAPPLAAVDASPVGTVTHMPRQGVSARLTKLAKVVEGGLSAPFHVNVLGTSAVRVRCAEDRYADVAVTVAKELAVAGRGMTMLTVRDRFLFQNHTDHQLRWSEASPAATGAAVELLLPTDGADVPLRWSGHDERRLMQLRFEDAAYDWCMPFSPFQSGGQTLQFRRSSDSFAETDSPTRFLRLSVTNEATHIVLAVHSLDATTPLPFHISNCSGWLLAVRQLGTAKPWDLLGIGESAEFALDSTVSGAGRDARRLQLVMRNPSGAHEATATTSVADLDAEVGALALRCSAIVAGGRSDGSGRKWATEERALGGRQSTPSHARQSTALPPLEIVLLSVGCMALHRRTTVMDSADGAAADATDAAATAAANATNAAATTSAQQEASFSAGWLCASQSRLTFLLPSPPSGDEPLSSVAGVVRAPVSWRRTSLGGVPAVGAPRRQLQRRVSYAPGKSWRWLALDELPVSFEEIASIDGGEGVGRDAVWIATKRGERLKLVDLRDCASTLHQLRTLWMAHREVRHTLFVMRLLAERTAGMVTSADLVAPFWSVQGDGPRRSVVASHDAAYAARSARAAAVLCSAARVFLVRRDVQQQRRGGMPDQRAGGSAREEVDTLAEAVRNNDEATFAVLLSHSASPHSFSLACGMSALHLACHGGHAGYARQLLEAGAHPETLTRDGWGQSALHLAAAGAWRSCVQSLLEFGADPRQRRKADGKTPADVVAPCEPQLRLGLERATTTFGQGAFVPRRELVEAVERGWLGMVRRLLQWRAHPDSVGGADGISALSAACRNGDSLLTAILVNARASVNGAVAAVGSPLGVGASAGLRPLHFAAQSGNVQCVITLLRARANPMACDDKKRLPIFHCPPHASASRECLLRALATFGGSKLAAHHAKSSMHMWLHVRAEGPVRHLQIGEGTTGPGTDAGTGTSTSTDTGTGANTGTGAGTSGVVTHRLRVSMRRFGVTWLDDEPREVLYMSVSGVRFECCRTAQGSVSASAALGWLQVDNALEDTEFPVLIAPRQAMDRRIWQHTLLPYDGIDDIDWSQDGGHTSGVAVAHLEVADLRMRRGIVCVERVTFGMQPLVLCIEHRLIGRALRLGAALAAEASTMTRAISAEGSGGASQRINIDSRQPSFERRAAAAPAATAAPSVAYPSAVASVAPVLWDARTPPPLYLRRVELDSVRIAVHVRMAPPGEHAGALNEHGRLRPELGPAISLGAFGLPEWPLELPALRLDEVLEARCGMTTVSSRAMLHYSRALLDATYKLLLSLDEYGQLNLALSAVQGGLHTFAEHSRQGHLLSGAAFGVGGVTLGLSDWALGSLRQLNMGTSSALAHLTFDTRFKYLRGRAQARRATSTLSGLRIGMGVLGGGVATLVTEPLRASRADGVRGLARGLLIGTVGGVAKIVSGGFFLLSKAAEGLASDLHRFDILAPSRDVPRLRMRQPRQLLDGELLPYPPPTMFAAAFDAPPDAVAGCTQAPSSCSQSPMAAPTGGARSQTACAQAQAHMPPAAPPPSNDQYQSSRATTVGTSVTTPPAGTENQTENELRI